MTILRIIGHLLGWALIIWGSFAVSILVLLGMALMLVWLLPVCVGIAMVVAGAELTDRIGQRAWAKRIAEIKATAGEA